MLTVEESIEFLRLNYVFFKSLDFSFKKYIFGCVFFFKVTRKPLNLIVIKIKQKIIIKQIIFGWINIPRFQ